MKKLYRRLLVLLFFCAVLYAAGMPVSARTIRTREEAMSWVRSQVGTPFDVDGAYGEQCVDFIMAYYQYLGVDRVRGNGQDYAHNPLPAGWQRLQGVQPQYGDILVYTGGKSGYGHVAVYEADRVLYHQNVFWNGKTQKCVCRTNWHYLHMGSTYWGVIRPDYLPDQPNLDLGDGFCAQIEMSSCGKPIAVDADDNVVLASAEGQARSKWIFDRQSDGSYILTNCRNGEKLDVSEAGTVSGTNVGTWSQWTSYNPAQRWFIRENGDHYRLIPMCAQDLSLDVCGAETENGTNIQLYSHNQSAAQKFSIVTADPDEDEDRWVCSDGRWWYCHRDGSYSKEAWEAIDGNWYYFDAEGWMQIGWQAMGGHWYYLNESGHMLQGWQAIDGHWYYFDSLGHMLEDWQAIGGHWYYFDEAGHMQYDWQKIGENWFFLDGLGHMTSGWQQLGEYFFCFNDAGHMLEDWQLIDGSWYYFDSSGHMAADAWIWMGDCCYYLGSDGAMVKDAWIGDCYVNEKGVWDPGATKAQWIESDGKWWYRHADGSCTRDDWEYINGYWYHFDASGWMQTGWQLIGEAWYYLEENGHMASDTWIGEYYVDQDGVMYASDGGISSEITASAEPQKAPEAPGISVEMLTAELSPVSEAQEPEARFTPETVNSDGGRWEETEGGFRYLLSDGSYAVSNWICWEKAYYYLDENGFMVTGKQLIDGITCQFDPAGILQFTQRDE